MPVSPKMMAESTMTNTSGTNEKDRISQHLLALADRVIEIDDLLHPESRRDIFIAAATVLNKHESSISHDFVQSLFASARAMASHEAIVGRQLRDRFMTANGQMAVHKARNEATDLAKQILDQGKSDASKERRDNINKYYQELDEAMGNITCKWGDFDEAARSCVYWRTTHDEAVLKLDAFEQNKETHIGDIKKHKEHIQDLSGPLQKLNLRHGDQHLEKEEEKVDAIVEVTKHAYDDQSLYHGATVFSNTKKGHERHASYLAKKNQELVTAGKILRDMLGLEHKLRRKVTDTLTRKAAAEARLEVIRKSHDEARIHGECKWEAIKAYAKAIGDDSILTDAVLSTYLCATAYDRTPDHSYEWVCKWVHAKEKVLKAAGVQDVDSVLKGVVETLGVGEAASDKGDGEEKGEEGDDEAEGVEGKKGRKKGTGKKKSKGKGKGKK